MEFLKSVRFWKIVGASITWGLMLADLMPKEVGDPIIAVLVGSTLIRTIDRNSEMFAK